MIETVRKIRCAVCGSDRLDVLFELPGFPITGIFIEQPQSEPAQGIDQALERCTICSHVQLRHIVPASNLYGSAYTHRSSTCCEASRASNAFVDFVDHLTAGRVFDCIMEVGCNDLTLLKEMAPRGRHLIGIDPIWRGVPPDGDESIQIIGKFIEEVDFDKELSARPQLIFSVHNLEHISEPTEQLARLMEIAADDALFVVEVPDLDTMVHTMRFDKVFHQHIQYFSLASFLRAIDLLGAHYVGHTYDHHNSRNWSGSLIVAFRKGGGKREAIAASPLEYRDIACQYAIFRRRMEDVAGQVARFDGPVWGYGAGQMVPSVAYHLRSDLSFLRGILDDNPQRAGMYYPYLAPAIQIPAMGTRFDNDVVMILALDSVRSIMNRLQPLNPRHIIVPINTF